MGGCLSNDLEVDFDGPVGFYHFHILRAIGKGAFGKVCIVKKRDTKQMYAMKYMNKIQIIKKRAVENVFREIDLLKLLDHPFLVNMWYTFQDVEDIFLVLDLMLGGDLSYHLEKEGRFQVGRVRLYMAELGLALDYLRAKQIIHRDVKPANMLLDSEGHVHLTDFNVATVVQGHNITSVTGTKPYMAPEVLRATSGGYSYAVDWWSLGVSAYEMLRGQRPFNIERQMSNSEIYSQLRHNRPSASARWDTTTCDILKMLLHPDEDQRIQSVEQMRRHRFFDILTWAEVEDKTAKPSYIPPQNRINCDPTHELEEMIVEPNPLHKKQHRLSKRSYKNEDEAVVNELERIGRRFKPYNREREHVAVETELLSPLAIEKSTRSVTNHLHSVAEVGTDAAEEEEEESDRTNLLPEGGTAVVERGVAGGGVAVVTVESGVTAPVAGGGMAVVTVESGVTDPVAGGGVAGEGMAIVPVVTDPVAGESDEMSAPVATSIREEQPTQLGVMAGKRIEEEGGGEEGRKDNQERRGGEERENVRDEEERGQEERVDVEDREEKDEVREKEGERDEEEKRGREEEEGGGDERRGEDRKGSEERRVEEDRESKEESKEEEVKDKTTEERVEETKALAMTAPGVKDEVLTLASVQRTLSGVSVSSEAHSERTLSQDTTEDSEKELLQ